MTRTRTPSVLFICTGNICRSPTAQALLLHKAAALGWDVHADSAAVTSEEIGHSPDPRAMSELRRRGVAMPAHRARRVTKEDFETYDLVIGMTASHNTALRRVSPQHADKVALMMDFADGPKGLDVPDPWYGSEKDFVQAFDMIERGVDGLLKHWREPAAR